MAIRTRRLLCSISYVAGHITFKYVALADMWRSVGTSLGLDHRVESCATYLRGYKVRRKAITSGFRDQPPTFCPDRPRSSVASARFLVARSVSA